MGSTPVVDGHTPPTQGCFGVAAPGEGQRFAHLMSTHASSRPVASLDGRGVGGGVAELVERLMDPLLTAVGVADLAVDQPLALPVDVPEEVSTRFRRTLEEGPDYTEKSARMLMFLVSGQADVFSGRHFGVHDSIDDLQNRVDEILRKDLYTLGRYE